MHRCEQSKVVCCVDVLPAVTMDMTSAVMLNAKYAFDSQQENIYLPTYEQVQIKEDNDWLLLKVMAQEDSSSSLTE